MSSHDATPPRLAEWLVGLIATQEQTATIVGDLLEEFSAIASRAGLAPARRWYWRQSVWTVAHLLRGQVRHAPAETIAFGIGGFLLWVLVERALQISAETAVKYSNVYAHVNAVTFWRAIDTIARYLLPGLVGWVIARAARGREMMAVLSAALATTIWIVAIYTAALLATSGIAQINIPAFSLTSLFCPPDSGPPHLGSTLNTLRLMRFTLIYWWIPTILALLMGAALGRTISSRRTLSRATDQ